jgi:IclR family pca regulon transcriptional regulator
MNAEPSGQYIQSLARGLDVIRAFDADHPRMTLSEVAKITSLSRATARRFLLTLLELGYVSTDGRLFSLMPRILELGFSYLSSLSFPEIAQPHLEELSRVTRESSSASVLDGTDIVYVARVPARRIMSVRITIGTRFPAHATSMGRVLLAGLPPEALQEYIEALHATPLTSHTITDPALLREQVEHARLHGYALVDQELEIGLRSVAAPIRNREGRVVAAINVSTSAAGSTVDDTLAHILPPLLEAAEAISADRARSSDPQP